MAKDHLLLVERDAKVRRLLRVSLEQAGYTVETARDGVDALERLESAVPSLVLAATDLPKLDGYALVRQMKDDDELVDVPVIFLQASDSIEDKIRGLELGVEEYLTKPIFVKELLSRVQVLLAKGVRNRLSTSAADTRVQGQLSDLPTVDLLESLEAGQQSAILRVRAGEREGAVYFQDGEIVDARLKRLRGEEVVFRLLCWTEGTYEVELCDVDVEPIIESSTRALIEAGMRHAAQYHQLLADLPPLTAVMQVNRDALQERMSEIPDELDGILSLFDGRRTLLDVIDESPFDDLSTLSTISKLFGEELLSVVAQGPTALDRSATPLVPEPDGDETVDVDDTAVTMRPPSVRDDAIDASNIGEAAARAVAQPFSVAMLESDSIEPGDDEAGSRQEASAGTPSPSPASGSASPSAGSTSPTGSHASSGEATAEARSGGPTTPRRGGAAEDDGRAPLSQRPTVVASTEDRPTRTDDEWDEAESPEAEAPGEAAAPEEPAQGPGDRRSAETASAEPQEALGEAQPDVRDGAAEEEPADADAEPGLSGRAERHTPPTGVPAAARADADADEPARAASPEDASPEDASPEAEATEAEAADEDAEAAEEAATAAAAPSPSSPASSEPDEQAPPESSRRVAHPPSSPGAPKSSERSPLSSSGVSAAFFANAPEPEPEEPLPPSSDQEPTYLTDAQMARKDVGRKVVMGVVGVLAAVVLFALVRSKGQTTLDGERPAQANTTTGSPTQPAAAPAPTTAATEPVQDPAADRAEGTEEAAAGEGGETFADGEGDDEGGEADEDLPDVEDPFGEAKKLLNGGQYEKAIPMAKAAIRADPKNGDAYFFLATAYESLGRREEMMDAYRACATEATKGRYLNYCAPYAPDDE